MHRFLNPLFVAVSVLVATCFGAEPRKPNIIFILSDDLAMGDVGAYGQKLIQTPHLDQLGREGTRYLQAYTGTSVCSPARTSLMTGRHEFRSGVTHTINERERMSLKATTVAVGLLMVVAFLLFAPPDSMTSG